MPICRTIANDDEPVQTETVEKMLINCAYLNGGEWLRMKYWRKGWDSNPRGSVNPLAVFKTAALSHSATLPCQTRSMAWRLSDRERFGNADPLGPNPDPKSRLGSDEYVRPITLL